MLLGPHLLLQPCYSRKESQDRAGWRATTGMSASMHLIHTLESVRLLN